MIGVQERIKREHEVVHFVAHRVADLSQELASVAARGGAFPRIQGRGDGAAAGDVLEAAPQGPRAREIYIRDLHLGALRVKGRDFR